MQCVNTRVNLNDTCLPTIDVAGNCGGENYGVVDDNDLRDIYATSYSFVKHNDCYCSIVLAGGNHGFDLHADGFNSYDIGCNDADVVPVWPPLPTF